MYDQEISGCLWKLNILFVGIVQLNTNSYYGEILCVVKLIKPLKFEPPVSISGQKNHAIIPMSDVGCQKN